MKTIVAKFGGTSVSDAAQIGKVAAIVRESEARRIVVVSAPGKRSGADKKITDMLYACHSALCSGDDALRAFHPIAERYRDIARSLGLGEGFARELGGLEARLREGVSADELVSRGEYLSARLISEYLDFEFVDAAELIRFSDSVTVDEAATYARMAERLTAGGRFVVPGFYGSRPDGGIQLFSRGGSDISAALVARGVGADCYENWTDVSGLLSADPRIVDGPTPIREVTYGELRELAYLGANVFHEEAVFPVSAVGIPINIRNTNEPAEPGTMIVAATGRRDRIATGIAGKRGYRALRLEKPQLDKDGAFGQKLAEAGRRLGLPIVHTARGSDSALLLVPEDAFAPREAQVREVFLSELGCGAMGSELRLALLGVVGEGIAKATGVLAAMLAELDRSGIETAFLSLGHSERSVLLGVRDEAYAAAMQALYRALR